MNLTDINSFLKLGYFLDYKNPRMSIDFSGINKNKYMDLHEEELVNEGSRLFIKSLEKRFLNGKRHVVPISGGLDSRAILAGLLYFTDASNIETYTFGTPGTLDFEIGCNIANIVGTQHKCFPLTNYKYDFYELLDISKRIDRQTVLFHHPPIWELDQYYSDSLIWSGFNAGLLTGAVTPKVMSESLETIKQNFINKNRYTMDLTSTVKDSEIYEYIEYDKNLGVKKLSIEEQMHFMNRQLKFIEPHVLIKGFNYVTPFTDEDLLLFFLSIDNRFRINQHLYKNMLQSTFPDIFSYPTKNSMGLPLNSGKVRQFSGRVFRKLKSEINKFYPMFKDKNINYLDFNTGIREKRELNNIVKDNINDLADRKIIDWIDIKEIFEKHVNQKKNYSKALLLLTSLEIHLKSSNEKIL
ncbi:hypothetical protein [Alkalihalobacillus sp. LMS39]|uniref:hypothetical protein n=1 Tax=Alkalihalobacillus sp. LMS39 TaxID=2924032 RepID=UPI001FB37ABA|nr:hypothetical protein [Alkalihalobacillus sp. LMS39]UOE93869.1 hypothetical protein MM271_22295 [Alkalihalobacillus sp. LMS39]